MERKIVRQKASKLLFVSLLLFALLATTLSVGKPMGTAQVFAANTESPTVDTETESVEDESRRLTESDDMEDMDMQLSRFLSNLQANDYYKTNSNDMRNELNRALYALIPQRLFFTDGEYAYVGNDYAFGIRTSGWETAAPMADVIFANNIYTYNERLGEVVVRVETVMRRFQYVPTDTEPCWEDIGKGIPIFYVQNIDFGCHIENEHALNTYDIGYDKQTDAGAIIRQSRTNFSGIMVYDTEFSLKPTLTFLAKKGLGAIVKQIPHAETLYKILKEAKSILDVIDASIVNDSHAVISNNERYIFTEQSKTTQQDDPEIAFLSKTAVIEHSEDEHFFIDTYAEARFLFDDTPVATHCFLFTKYNIAIKEDGLEARTINTNNTAAKESVLFDEKSSVLQEGDNTGYNRTEQSKHTWQFTPDKTGEYTVTASNGQISITAKQDEQDNFSPLSKKMKLTAGETYFLTVKDVDTGTYRINVAFTPEELQIGDHTLKVQNDAVYYSVYAETRRAFNLCLSESRQNILISVIQGNHMLTELTQDSVIGFVLQGTAILKIQNISQEDVSFVLSLRDPLPIAAGERYTNSSLDSAFFAFTPTYGGQYTWETTTSSAHALTLTVYDSVMAELSTNEKAANKIAFLADTTYYLKIETENHTAVDVESVLRLDPQRLRIAVKSMERLSTKEVYAFVAENCSAEYIFQSENNLQINVCDENMQTCCVNGLAYLEKGKVYYVFTEGTIGKEQISIGVSATEALTGELNAYGNKLIAFTAPFDAEYDCVGANEYAYFSRELNPIRMAFAKGSTYYVQICGEPNAPYAIQILPRAGLLQSGIKYNLTAQVYTIHITQETHIRTYCSNGVTSYFSVYDKNTFQKLLSDSADNAPKSIALATGEYYIQWQIQNGNQVTFEQIDYVAGMAELPCGQSFVSVLRDSEPLRYTFTCNASSAYLLRLTSLQSITYDLSVVERNSDTVISGMHDFETELVSDGQGVVTVRYTLSLQADKTYVFSLSSANAETAEVRIVFGLPTQLQQVYIGAKECYRKGETNKKTNIVMGETYTLTWQYNDMASRENFVWKILDNQNPNNIARKAQNNGIEIGFNVGAADKEVHIIFSDDYGDYTAVLVLKLPVQANISMTSDYIVSVNLQNEEGAPWGDTGVLQKTEIVSNGTTLASFTGKNTNLAELPIWETTNIYANVTIKINNTTYVYKTLGISYKVAATDFIGYYPERFSDEIRLVIDGTTNTGVQYRTFRIAQNIKYLFVIGAKSNTYQGIEIIAENIAYLCIRDFKAENSHLQILSDNVRISTDGTVSFGANSGEAVVTAKNLTVEILGTFRIIGMQGNLLGKRGIMGLKCDDLTVKANGSDSKFIVHGANGVDGNVSYKNGSNGGIGIYCNSLIVNNCLYEFVGGNGGNGFRGADGANGVGTVGGRGGDGGRGGNGASQIYAVNSVVGVVVNYAGSCGGNGGDGGRGGNGANGIDSSTDRDGKNGGNGGDGGYGGSGAVYIQAPGFASTTASSGQRGIGGRGGNGGNGAKGHSDSSTKDKATAGGNGGDGGYGGSGRLYGQMGNGGNGGDGGGVGQYGNGKRGGDGGDGYIGGNGGNGSRGRKLGKNGGNGGNGGNSVITYNAAPCDEVAAPGVGGSGGKKATGGHSGAKGQDGITTVIYR